VGELRTKDLAGRPVDARAEYAGGATGEGLEGLSRHIRAKREKDFLDNLCRQLLGYALGRSLLPSDDAVVEGMRRRLASGGHRFGSMVEAIVVSPQFLNKRGRDVLAERGN